jgi:hypothetical protein
VAQDPLRQEEEGLPESSPSCCRLTPGYAVLHMAQPGVNWSVSPADQPKVRAAVQLSPPLALLTRLLAVLSKPRSGRLVFALITCQERSGGK